MWRMSLIERRSGKDFDAVTGPVVVCVGLIVALVLNFAFKVCFSFPNLPFPCFVLDFDFELLD